MATKLQASSFYQHFLPEERPTVDYFVGLFNRFLFQQDPILTGFLNPREQSIFQTVVGQQFRLTFFGGYPNAERQRALLQATEDEQGEFAINLLVVKYNHRFAKLSHPDIYGVLMNLGIEQSVFGDILVDDTGQAQILVTANLSDYIVEQVTRIGRTSVKLLKLPLTQLVVPLDESSQDEILVNSRRLDAVVAAVGHYSRAFVKELAASGQIKKNWLMEKETSVEVELNDMISVRHFGRFKIIGEIGETRRGKHRLQVQIWRAKKGR